MDKEKVPAEIIEFQPDAQEIENSRLPWLINLCVWIPLLVLILAVTWASLARVDVVIQGHGKIVTDQPTIVMKPLERSVVKEVNVRIGDTVKKDDILVTFDPTINNAEAERLRNEILALDAQFARLKAEFAEQDYDGEGGDQFQKWQTAIFRQRHEYYQERMQYYTEALNLLEASRKSRSDNLVKQRERLVAVKQLEDIYKGLYEKEAAPMKDLIQTSITRMEMEATVEQISNDLLELEHRRGTTIAEKNSFIQEWRNGISEEMVKVERNLIAVSKEYEKAAQLIEYVYLRSPCDAVVHEIAPFSPGSAVREAEALITLIPLVGAPEMECEIRPEDIAKVQPGANVRIKLSSYQYQRYGTLDGVVRNISEDTLEKTNAGLQTSYYRARIIVRGKLKNVPSTFRLIPGMEAQCEIKCSRRRVIEYILYPLLKALDETAREP